MTAATHKNSIAGLLLDEGVVDQDEVRFAERVQSKLADWRPLLTILKERGSVSDADIKSVLRKRRLDVRLGALLVELGVLDARDLQMALDLQHEDPNQKRLLGEVLVDHRFVE